MLTPDLLPADVVLQRTAARDAEVAEILRLLAQDPPPPTLLLAGARGSGRSLILQRVALELAMAPGGGRQAVLSVPLWEVQGGGLVDVLRYAARALGIEAPSAAGAPVSAREIQELIAGWARLEGRRPVLLLDDLDQLLERMIDGGAELLAFLDRPGALSVIGVTGPLVVGAPLDQLDAPDVALGPLPPDGARRLLDHLAGPAVLDLQARDPGAVGALLAFAAGHTATVVTLAEVLRLHAPTTAAEALMLLLDRGTPLWRERLGGLAPQAARVLVGLLRAEDPCTAAEIAGAVHLDVNTVSSQLSRLLRAGVVEKVSLPPEARAGFQVVDRRLHAWFHLQQGGEARARLAALASCLSLQYGCPAGPSRVPPRWAPPHLPPTPPRGALAATYDAVGPPQEASNPDAAPGWIRLADLRRTVLRHYAEAEEAYQRGLALDPGLAWGWNNLGVLLRGTFRRPDEAERAFRMATQRDPLLAVAWVNLGNVLAAMGRPPEAEEALRRAPDHPAAWASLAELAEGQARWEDAMVAWRESLARDPAPAARWEALAGALGRLNRLDEAERAWREVIRRAPEQASGWAGLGAVLARRGATAAAEKALRRGLALDQTDAEAWRTLADLLLPDRPDAAEEALRAALARARDPNDAQRHRVALAWLLGLRSHPEAEPLARAALAARPSEPAAALVLATALAQGREPDEALRLLRRLSGAPWSPDCWAFIQPLAAGLARAGRAADLAHLLDVEGFGWRPLQIALLAVTDPSVLQRVNPVVREAAEVLAPFLPAPAPAAPAAVAKARPPRPRVRW